MRRALVAAGAISLLSVALPGCAAAARRTALPFERRVAAEWEPAVGVLVTWPLALPRELITDFTRNTTLFVVVADAEREAAARKTFAEWSLDAARIRYVRRPTKEGLYGVRDWGAYAAFGEAGALTHRDPRYLDYALSGYETKNLTWWKALQPGLDWSSDDETPSAVAAAVGEPREELTFCFTGGNVEVDGMGAAFATEVLARENAQFGVSEETLRAEAQRLLGIRNLTFLPDFERFPAAQHMDCVARLLDEERFLVKRVPADHPDFAQIEKLAAAISKAVGPWGRPYEVLRIDAPRYEGAAVAAYTNSLILNRHIYVPIFGIPGDEAALETWRRAMPGYVVKGYRFDGAFAWTYTDALHCRTKALWDPKMLHLRHRRLDRTVPPRTELPLRIEAWDYSKAGLDRNAVSVHWRLGGEQPFQVLPMKRDSSGGWAALLPGAPEGSELQYWIEATDRAGHRATLPPTAPEGFFRAAVQERR